MQCFLLYFANASNALIFDGERERKKKTFFAFFSLLFVTIIVVDGADGASGGYLVCSVYAPLTTSLHNMMLQPNASGIYDSTFEFSTEILFEAVGRRRRWYC